MGGTKEMEWQFNAVDAKAALLARRAFMDFLQVSCALESDCESAQIVFVELVTNVMRHAPGPIDITLQSDARGLVVLDVYDSGEGFVAEPTLPPISSESGRGLYIVSKLCAGLSSTRTASGNKVSVVLPVTTQPAAFHLVKQGRTPSLFD
jgi:signal transduction histidine kinase